MVRAMCFWLATGVVIATLAGCSGSFWQSDEEYRERSVARACDDPSCRECVAPVRAEARPAPARTHVAEAPAPTPAADPELAAIRAQIQKLQAEIARVKAQPSAPPAYPAYDGAAVARINGEISELAAQKAAIERRIAELEDQRRMLTLGGGRVPEAVQISKRAEPGDSLLQAEEARLREALKQYETPRR